MGHDVMISYSTRNVEIVQKITSLLEQKGIKCWYAKRDIPPGASFPAQCVEAIEKCTIMILVFSSDSNESPHLARELSIAADNRKMVIPFKIEDALPNKDLKYFFINYQWLDASRNQDEGINDLLKAVEAAIPPEKRQYPKIEDGRIPISVAKDEDISASKPREIAIAQDISKPAEPKVDKEISISEREPTKLNWPEIGHMFLKQVGKSVDLSQLPFKPTYVSTEKDIEEQLEVDWSVSDKYYFAVWLSNKREHKVDLKWGYYSENEKRDPIFRKTCDAISESRDLLNQDGEVSINDYIYCFNEESGCLGFDKKLRMDFSKLADPSFVRHISDQIIFLSQKIYPMIKMHI